MELESQLSDALQSRSLHIEDIPYTNHQSYSLGDLIDAGYLSKSGDAAKGRTVLKPFTLMCSAIGTQYINGIWVDIYKAPANTEKVSSRVWNSDLVPSMKATMAIVHLNVGDMLCFSMYNASGSSNQYAYISYVFWGD